MSCLQRSSQKVLILREKKENEHDIFGVFINSKDDVPEKKWIIDTRQLFSKHIFIYFYATKYV